MAFNEIIKNIYTFSNILVQAHGVQVKGWDLKSLKNAMKWAVYCEKVSSETKEKTYAADLDKNIRNLTILLNPVSLLHLDVNVLAQASSVLTKVLLENPFLPKPLHQALLKLDVCNTSSTIQAERSNVDMEVYTLLADRDACQCGCVYKQGQYILDRLASLYELCHFNRRYPRFLTKFMMALTKVKQGMDMILCSLLADVNEASQYDAVVAVKEQIRQCLVDDHSSMMYDCDIEIASEVCNADDDFSTFYIEHLHSWGNSMYPEYGLTDTGQLYQWRCSNDNEEKTRDFCHLCSCVCTLAISGNRVKHKLFEMVTVNADKSYVNVWRDVLAVCSQDGYNDGRTT